MTTTTIETKVSHKIVNVGRVYSYSVDFSPHRRSGSVMSISFPDGDACGIPIPLELAHSISSVMMGGAVKMTLEFTEPTLTAVNIIP